MPRCSKCLLPSSLPESSFGKDNECSWCRSGYPDYRPKGTEKLEEFLRPYRRQGGAADCLVGLSGGKDSSFALLHLVKKYGMRAEAFTYNHGGMVDFAMENAKKVCSKLGVRHHIVSLPHEAHMKSFRRFFKTWVKHPSNITAGMACVACKHLHILGAELAVRRKIPLIVWANCPLEYAPFIALRLKSGGANQLNRSGIFKGIKLLAKEISGSKELLISMLQDCRVCIPGGLAYSPTTVYFKFRFPRLKHLFFYDYFEWNPSKIVNELEINAGWKKPENLFDDWHSDCVFHVLKEYMFQKTFGASYTDSFLSSQIRFGIITRETAMEKLLQSKRHFKQTLHSALDFAGLSSLRPYIDPSCFDMSWADANESPV